MRKYRVDTHHERSFGGPVPRSSTTRVGPAPEKVCKTSIRRCLEAWSGHVAVDNANNTHNEPSQGGTRVMSRIKDGVCGHIIVEGFLRQRCPRACDCHMQT